MSQHSVRNKKGIFVKNVIATRSQNLNRGSVGPNEKCDSPSIPNTVETIEWDDGRRVVELGTLAQNLGKCTAEGCEVFREMHC